MSAIADRLRLLDKSLMDDGEYDHDLLPIALEVQGLEEQVAKIPALQASANQVQAIDLRLKDAEGRESVLNRKIHTLTHEHELAINAAESKIKTLSDLVNRLQADAESRE